MKKKMYICKKEMKMKTKLFLLVTLLMIVGCSGNTTPADDGGMHSGRWNNVQFWPRQGAYPAREWTLMPVTVRHGKRLNVSMERQDGKGDRTEWWLKRPRDLADTAVWCTYLYLPPVEPGRYCLRAVADGDTGMVSLLRADAVLVGENIDGGMPDFRRGFLLDAVTGRPVAGRTVELKRYFTDFTEASVRTDTLGGYSFVRADSNYHPYVAVSGEQWGGFTWVDEEEPWAEDIEAAKEFYAKGLADTALPSPREMGRTDRRVHPNFWHSEGLVFRHSIDSAEFARRFPQYVMDSVGRWSLSDAGRLFAVSASHSRARVGETLRVEIGTAIKGLTVMCLVRMNGKEREAYAFVLEDGRATLEVKLDEEGVADVELFALWHGEMRNEALRVAVGDRKRAWIAGAVHPPCYADMASQLMFLGSAGYYRMMQRYE